MTVIKANLYLFKATCQQLTEQVMCLPQIILQHEKVKAWALSNIYMLKEGDRVVQFRAYDDSTRDWCDLQPPDELKAYPPHTRFINLLPARIFEGKKEGDVISMQFDGTAVEFTLKQLENHNFQVPFEEALEYITSS